MTKSDMLSRTSAARRLPTVAAVLAVAACGNGAQAPEASQAPDPGTYSEASYEVEVTRGVLVPMRDGVLLSVDIYAPAGAEAVPGILTSTPYDNNGARTGAEWFAARGYAVVAADVRGRYDSGGEWDPFGPRHKTDGYDLVEWIAAQPWCTGKVGMIGGSYLGWTQWWTASTAPPHLAAIAPKVAPPDQFENLPYQNGVLVGGWMLDWAAMLSGRTQQRAGDGGYDGWSETRQDPPHTPYIEINASRGLRAAPWFEEWYRSNKSTDDYWTGISYQSPESYSMVTVPSLSFTGWFDANHPGSPMNYMGMKAHGATPEARRPSMVIGPWIHGINTRSSGGIDYGPAAVIDVDGYVARWFDHFLKGEDNGVENDPPVHVFVMGENAWHAEEDWPLPQTEWTNFYVTSGSGRELPRRRRPPDDHAARRRRPRHLRLRPPRPHAGPLRQLAQQERTHRRGAGHARLGRGRRSPGLPHAAPRGGRRGHRAPIEAKLYASTSATDTDWFIRLVDIHPDGYRALLTEAVMRARNRDPENEGRFNGAQLSTIEPDQVYEYTIHFWRGTGNLFQEGHRIGIEISSSWYPYYLPEPQHGRGQRGPWQPGTRRWSRPSVCTTGGSGRPASCSR